MKNNNERTFGELQDGIASLSPYVQDVIILLDLDFRIVSLTRAEAGLSVADLTGMPLYMLAGEDRQDEVRSYFQEALATRKPVNYYTEYRRPEGTTVYYESVVTAIFNDEEPQGLLVVSRDVTEYRKTENEKREVENQYRLLFDNIPSGFMLVEVVTNGQNVPVDLIFVTVNPGFEKITGFAKEAVSGKRFTQVFADWGNDVVDWIATYGEVALSGNAKHFEQKIASSNQYYNIIAYKSGPRHCAVVFSDITQRKQIVNALAQSEERFRTTIDTAAEGVMIVDLKANKRIYVNAAACRMFGYSQSELLALPIDGIHPDTKRDSTMDLFRQQMTGSLPLVQGIPCKRKDDSVFYAHVTGNTFQMDGNEYGVGFFTDITELREAEESFVNEATWRRILQDQSRDGIVVLDQDGNVYEANNRFAGMLGYTVQEVSRLSVFDWEYRLSPEQTLEMIRSVDEKGDHFETSHRRKDGTIYDVEISTNAAVVDGQKLIFCICRDITERKQAEEEIRRDNDILTTVNYLLDMSLSNISLEAILRRALNAVLSISWLSFENKGCIFLADEQSGSLVMAVHNNFADPILGTCAIVPFGTCLCGRAAATGEIQFADHVDERHEISYDAMVPHGHYIVPIKTANRVLGVMNLYVAEGHAYYSKEVEFLSAVSNTLAGIIERSRTETQLQESEKLYSQVANSVKSGLFIVQDGTFVFVNKSLCDLTGFPESHLIGMNPLELVHKEDREMVRENAIQMLKGLRSQGYEYRNVRKDGSIRNILESVTSIHYKGKRSTLGAYMDITESKALKDQLVVADRLSSIGVLAAGVAHEINNPMTGIIGFSDLLLLRDMPDDMRSDLQIINKEAVRVSEITKGLLSFARENEAEKTSVSIRSVIESVLKLRTYEHRKRNIEVVTTLPEDLPDVSANKSQLEQVFLNLVINAEQAILEINNEGQITISGVLKENVIRITVADNGPGIPEAIVGSLFDPFFTTKKEGKGTGLGLSISYGIIMDHGGKIWAENNPDQGAAFIMELPVAVP